MKYNSKKVLKIITLLILISAIGGKTFAHSGKTDSNGGHRDNQNKSGLGNYHYHCGGYKAHLHENGVCPYSSSLSNSSSSTSSNSKSSTSTPTSKSSSESVATSSSVESIPVPTSTSALEQIVKATSIEINESITNMKVGETNKLTATITPENAKDKNITWSSDDDDIATVSSTGKIIALKAGMVNIKVTTANGKTDILTITVEEVEEIKEEKNSIVAPIQSNELVNTSTNNTEDTDAISGILGLGLIGGGSYLGYKKFKKTKK